MPFVTVRATTQVGNVLTGMYRTLALAQAAATASGGLVTALTTEVADQDIPREADIDNRWFVYEAPRNPAVQASINLQWAGTGEGFKLTWRWGVNGAAGNSWRISSGSPAGSRTKTFNTAGTRLTLPAPRGGSGTPPLATGADLLAFFKEQVGAYQLDVEYLDGTTDTTDFTGTTGSWRPVPDPDPSASPMFGGGSDASASVLGVHNTLEQTESRKFRDWMLRAHNAYFNNVNKVQFFWVRDAVGLLSVEATHNWLGQMPAIAQAFLKQVNFVSSDGSILTANTDDKKEALIRQMENMPVKIWYEVMRAQGLDDMSTSRRQYREQNFTAGTGTYQDYIDSTTGNLRTLDGAWNPYGSFPSNYDPETLDWVVYI